MARQTFFNHTAPKRGGARIAAKEQVSPLMSEKVEKRLLEIWRSPLTLVLFVWAILFAVAGLCFTYME